MTDLIVIKNRQAVTSSLQIAEDFEKNHNHVLRDIDNLKEGLDQKWTDLFFEDEYEHPQNKQKYRMYYMNRDGFTLLAMGFNGKKALEFKVKYIEAFNQMEKQLTQPKSQLEIMQMSINQLVEQEKRLNEQEAKIEAIEEKQNNITEILSLNNNDWRNKINRILNAIAMKLGGGQYFQELRAESYELLEKRANCLLNKRLENRKSKMALRGQSKTAISKLSKLDVIGEDKKLVSVYVTVIKEMAVKYQLNLADYQLVESEY
ncbi:Rha family transcriptional regulator [Ureibacillus sp. FSL E2-3493]|uniref:Rha family transcriptional regulator n=1 Tax=Ureibacillus sp. FSL E2-3493 TaxID=2921367 RepID=UPI0031194923